jgi:transposase-like protein
MSQERVRRSRVLRSADEKRALLAAWDESGLSARAFGKREGIRSSCLWRWRREATTGDLQPRKTGPKPRSAITFAPVHISKAAPAALVLAGERAIAEVVVGGDVRVRVLEGADMRQVSLLVRTLAGGGPC